MRSLALIILTLFSSRSALAGTPTTFNAGSILIPMDAALQDDGILDAYGLVYALLQADIPVHWVIDSGKAYGDPDISGLSTYESNAASSTATARDFAGGPFAIDAADAADALLVLSDWQARGWDAVAYITSASTTLEVSRTLFVAPTIAIFEDGNEDIAWGYLNAAGIPDADGNLWTSASSGNLSATEITGSSSTSIDGGLFASDGYPAYCHLNAMHYDPRNGAAAGLVQEIRGFAEDSSTSSLFECVASTTLENASSYGSMLSTGITDVGLGGGTVWTVENPGDELVQIDGAWGQAGGSVKDFIGTFNSDVRFISGVDGADTAYVLAYGHLDANPAYGKLSFLGGHEYDSGVPYSGNDEINGVRIFLNSYFTAGCADLAMAPDIALSGALSAVDADVALVLDYGNSGAGRARTATLTLTVPPGMQYVSDDAGGVFDSSTNTVTWSLTTIESGDLGTINLVFVASTSATYAFSATLDYTVDGTPLSEDWAGSLDVSIDADDDGLTDEEEGGLGTDALDPDTDGDGLGDGEEVNTTGTDPLDADTDGDGLGDGEEVNTTGTDPLDADTDGGGVDDGTEVNTNGTDPLNPADDNGGVDSDGDGLTDDEEQVLGTDSQNGDTDGDGLGDGEEVDDAGTDPLDGDTDGDGLDDGEEVDTTGTDPLDGDTDGDGLDDGEEVDTTGTDPLIDDTDGDGLSDGEEVDTTGTDALDPDTDGDGLGDGQEVNETGTDALDPDTDGDGLSDGDEVNEVGTDPLDADTDDGGASDGAEVIFDGTDPFNPDDDVRTDTDNDGLTDGEEQVLGTDPRDPDSDDDGLQDGEEVDSTGTDPLDPDTDGDRLDDGAEVNTTGTDPLDADTDGGGVDDGTEVLDNGTDPLNPADDLPGDSDGDGLSDEQEGELGTDPLDPDSDADGLGDGAEVNTTGTDPLDPDSDADGLQDGEEVNETGTDPLDPDSDADGLQDGEEVLTYDTDPLDPDSDDGGVPDGQEVLQDGTDPLDGSDDGGGPPDSGDPKTGILMGGAGCGCATGAETPRGLWALLALLGLARLRRRSAG